MLLFSQLELSLPGPDGCVPVRIRDTGTSQSLLLEGTLPLSDETATGAQVLVRGVEMCCAVVPLHSVEIKNHLFWSGSGSATIFASRRSFLHFRQ